MDKDFYENWFNENKHNSSNLTFKGAEYNVTNLLKICKYNFKKSTKVAEIGGAEGHNLFILRNKLKLKLKNLDNYELSSGACRNGKKLFKYINFINKDITKIELKEKYDLIILSDIIEHIPDDDSFLNNLSYKTNFVLIKLPLERCLFNQLGYKFGFIPKLGKSHPSGHLHDYNFKSGLSLISNYFNIISSNIEIISPTNYEIGQFSNFKKNNLKMGIFVKINFLILYLAYNLFPRWLYRYFFVTRLFVYAESKNFNDQK